MTYTEIQSVCEELERRLIAFGPEAAFVGLSALVVTEDDDANLVTILHPAVLMRNYVAGVRLGLSKTPVPASQTGPRPGRG